MNESAIDHEVRIRILEQIASDTKDTLKSMHKELRDELSNQFKWSVGMNFTIILTILAPIILHLAKLI